MSKKNTPTGRMLVVPGDRPTGAIFAEIPMDRGFAADESDTLDMPAGYWNGKNMIPFNFEKLRAVYTPTGEGITFSGTIMSVFIDNAGLVPVFIPHI